MKGNGEFGRACSTDATRTISTQRVTLPERGLPSQYKVPESWKEASPILLR